MKTNYFHQNRLVFISPSFEKRQGDNPLEGYLGKPDSKERTSLAANISLHEATVRNAEEGLREAKDKIKSAMEKYTLTKGRLEDQPSVTPGMGEGAKENLRNDNEDAEQRYKRAIIAEKLADRRLSGAEGNLTAANKALNDFDNPTDAPRRRMDKPEQKHINAIETAFANNRGEIGEFLASKMKEVENYEKGKTWKDWGAEFLKKLGIEADSREQGKYVRALQQYLEIGDDGQLGKTTLASLGEKLREAPTGNLDDRRLAILKKKVDFSKILPDNRALYENASTKDKIAVLTDEVRRQRGMNDAKEVEEMVGKIMESETVVAAAEAKKSVKEAAA